MQVMRDLYHHVENTAYHRLEKSGGASAKQLAAKNEWEKSVRTNRAHANGHPLPGSVAVAVDGEEGEHRAVVQDGL